VLSVSMVDSVRTRLRANRYLMVACLDKHQDDSGSPAASMLTATTTARESWGRMKREYVSLLRLTLR